MIENVFAVIFFHIPTKLYSTKRVDSIHGLLIEYLSVETPLVFLLLNDFYNSLCISGFVRAIALTL